MVSVISFASNRGNDNEWTPDQRKAEYMYLEGHRMKELGNMDAYYELVKGAYELDPHNTTISYYLGYCELLMNRNDSLGAESALEKMRVHIDKNISDYYENYFYADINLRIGKYDEALRIWNRLKDFYPEKIDLSYLIADSYGRVSNFKKAIDTYNQIEVTEGKTLPVSVRKINAYMSLNDSAGALIEGVELLNSAPNNVRYNILMGDLYQQLNLPDSAIVYYDKAEKIDPDQGLVYMAKAEYYNAQGDSAAYDNQIYKALISTNLDVQNKIGVLTNYIKQLLAENDSSERVENLFKVLNEQHPHEGDIHRLYSSYLVTKENYKGAAEQLSYALDTDPTNADDWKKLMFINLMGGDFSKSIEAAQKSLEYNPDNIDLYQYIGPAYYQMKEYDKALDVYNMALAKIDSTDVNLRSTIYGGIGDVYFVQGDTLKAFNTYDKALELNPANVSVMNNYAYFLAESGKNLEKAERLSGMAVKASPKNPSFLDTYAWIYFRKGDYKLAKVYIESAIENNADANAELFEHYGDILFMNGDPEEAVTQWEEALKINPESELLERKVKHKTYFFK